MLTKPVTRRSTSTASRIANNNSALTPERVIDKYRQDFQRRAANNNIRSPSPRFVSRADLGRMGKLLPYIGTAYVAWTAYELLLRSGQQIGFSNLGPWTEYGRCANPPSGPLWYKTRTTASYWPAFATQTQGCLPLQVINPALNTGNPWVNVPSNARSVIFGVPTNAAQDRATMVLAYGRPDRGPFELPEFQPAQSPLVVPVPVAYPQRQYWTARPEHRPISPPPMENTFPAPIPWKAVPYHSNSPYRQVWYDPPNLAVGSIRVIPNELAITHSFNGRPAQPPRNHIKDRPPPRTKERKLKLPAVAVGFIKIVNTLTEGVDFIDSAYNALPESKQAKWKDTPHKWRNPTVQAKLKALYDNYNDVDLSVFLDNLITNQIEDMFYGRLGRLNADASKRLGLLQYGGLNSLSRRTGNVVSEYRNFDNEKEN